MKVGEGPENVSDSFPKTISWLRRPFYTLCHMVRYERHALNYLGCVHLGCILIFLRQTL